MCKKPKPLNLISRCCVPLTTVKFGYGLRNGYIKTKVEPIELTR